MFDQTQTAGISAPIPTLGMESGVGVRNAPLSIWVFLGLGRLSGADTPPELARAVQMLNIVALAGLLVLACRWREPHLREAWLWTFALVCVNPLAVYLHRKIWAQSTLPFFCVAFLWAWSNRERRVGALLWGLVGMWLGQIHLSGFIFALAVALSTAASDVLRPGNRRAAWIPWLVGSGLGALTMLPWLNYCLQLERDHSLGQVFLRWFDFPILHSLYWQLWMSGPLGLGLSSSLGDHEFLDYLKYPIIGGTSTYVIGLAHLLILGLAGTALFRFLARAWREPVSLENAILGKPGADTHLLLVAAFIGYGILLTLKVGLISIPRHYLLITFPLEWLFWVLIFQQAFSAARVRWLLLGLWSCQLTLSVGYLGYVHVNQGARTGDYGVGYQYQDPVFSPRQVK